MDTNTDKYIQDSEAVLSMACYGSETKILHSRKEDGMSAYGIQTKN